MSPHRKPQTRQQQVRCNAVTTRRISSDPCSFLTGNPKQKQAALGRIIAGYRHYIEVAIDQCKTLKDGQWIKTDDDDIVDIVLRHNARCRKFGDVLSNMHLSTETKNLKTCESILDQLRRHLIAKALQEIRAGSLVTT